MKIDAFLPRRTGEVMNGDDPEFVGFDGGAKSHVHCFEQCSTTARHLLDTTAS